MTPPKHDSNTDMFTIDLRQYRGQRSLTDRCPDCTKFPAYLYPASGKGPSFLLCSCGYVKRDDPTE